MDADDGHDDDDEEEEEEYVPPGVILGWVLMTTLVRHTMERNDPPYRQHHPTTPEWPGRPG